MGIRGSKDLPRYVPPHSFAPPILLTGRRNRPHLQAQGLSGLIEDRATRGDLPLNNLWALAGAFSQIDTSEWRSQAAPQ